MLKKVLYIFDKRQKRNLIILFVALFIGGIMELLGVSLILPLVTVIMEPGSIENNKWAKMACDFFHIQDHASFVLFLLIVLIVIYIVKNIYLILMYSLQYRFTYNNQRRLAFRMMTCYINQDYLFHLSKNTSELQRNVMTDVSQFFQTVLSFMQLLSEVITCIFLVTYLMLKDPVTTLGVAAIIGVFVMIFYAWFRRILVRLGKEYRKENSKMIKWIHQSFGGIKEVKVMNREHYFLGHYDRCYQKVAVIQRRQNLMKATPKPVLETVSICGLLTMLAVRVAAGADMAVFIPTLSVFAIAAFRMLPAFNRSMTYLGAIMFTKASVDALYEDLQEVEKLSKLRERESRDKLEFRLEKEVSIEGVSFKYPNTDNYVLDHIDLKIPAHKSIALVGPSGAGKTTLADVVLGVLHPQTGDIKVDGIGIFDHLYAWHKALGYIPQAIYLMDDTIRNNVTFGLPADEIEEEQVWRALREAQLEAFVKSLEKGLDTVVGERGVRLSGGQRQRIGIARALYSNPQILVLDEATSALDNDTETAVMEAIESLQGEKTMIIIAHRLTTIRNCDLVYEVKDGKVVERDKKEVLKQA